MTNFLGGALASALQGVAPHWAPRSSLQGCPGNEGSQGPGFAPGELNYTTEQLGCLLAAISERLTVAVGGRQLRTTDAGCLVEDIRQATEALVWGEKYDDGLFDLFCERQALAGFVAALLAPCVPQVVRVQIWQSLSILVQNARRNTSFYYLLSGGHLNTLLAGDPDLRNEETLAYFVAFMKSLSLRLDGETALLVLDRRPEAAWAGGFPLFAQTVRLATHRDHMICTAARAALLNLLRIDHPEVRSRAAEAACQLLVPSIARALRVSWAASSAAIRLQDTETVRVALEAEDDLYGFINDLLSIDVVRVTEALAQGVFAASMLPLLACLAPPLAYPESEEGHHQQELAGVERQHSIMSHYDEVNWEQEQQQGLFVGTWFYGSSSSGSSFRIRRTEAGRLVFEEVSPKGRTVTGVLYPHGQWQEGDICFAGGDGYGRIRLRFVQEKMAVLANFRGTGENRWGPDTFAYQFLGTWFYGKDSTCFQITMTDSGQLRYKEQFPSGQRVSGALQPGAEWLQAELKFSDGKACGTVRLRFVSKQGTMISTFKGQKEKQWGPETTARKAAQDSSLTTSFGPAAAEIARTVSSMVLGLEPAQQGLVGAVIDRVLGSQASGLGEPRADESGALAAAGAEASPAEPPATAVALRALASCLRSIAGHKGIVVPLAKMMLWPTVPSALASSVYAPDAEAGKAAAAAFGLVAAAGGAEAKLGARGWAQAAASRRAPPSVLVPNPFRAELLALVGGNGDGPAPRESPLAAWTLREAREVLPDFGLEDAGLLPPCAGHGALGAASALGPLSPRMAEVGGEVEPWLRHWLDPAQTGTSSSSSARPGCGAVAMPVVIGGEVVDGCLPERLVGALRAQSGLPRMAQHALAAALLDLVRAPEAQVARRRAKAVAISALRESGDALWLSACQDFDGNDGTCGVAFTEMISGFLEEWEWHRDRDGRIDLLSTGSSVQTLLQCAYGNSQSPSASIRSSGSLPGRHAIRAFLTLRRLCCDLVALESRASGGQDAGGRTKEPCPLEMDLEHDPRGGAGRFVGQYPSLACVGPWGGVYAQGHALVLHPTQVLVVEPSLLEDGGGVHVCVPSWRAAAVETVRDARMMTLRVVAPLVGDGPAANRGGVEEVELRFPDTDSRAQALQHLQGAKARESRRLLSQLRAFIDRSVGQAAAEPLPTAMSAWAARWI